MKYAQISIVKKI